MLNYYFIAGVVIYKTFAGRNQKGQLMAVIFLGLGSNLGDRCKNIMQTMAELSKVIEVTKESSIIETLPMYDLEQPPFMNAVLEASTELSPSTLIALTKALERKMGRIKTRPYGPRVIDIDILYYDDNIINSDDLTIPHPLIAERDFVLRPMSEIAPSFRCPVSGKSIRQMLQELESAEMFAA